MIGINGAVVPSSHPSEKAQPLNENQDSLVVHTQEKTPKDGGKRNICLPSAALVHFESDDLRSMVAGWCCYSRIHRGRDTRFRSRELVRAVLRRDPSG